MFTHEFEEVEITFDGKVLYCDATVEYNLEDTAVGMVPYGDTEVYHPGDGIVVEILSVDILAVRDEDDHEVKANRKGHLPLDNAKALGEQLGELVRDTYSDVMIDAATKSQADDEADRADMARKERLEDYNHY